MCKEYCKEALHYTVTVDFEGRKNQVRLQYKTIYLMKKKLTVFNSQILYSGVKKRFHPSLKVNFFSANTLDESVISVKSITCMDYSETCCSIVPFFEYDGSFF